MLEIYHSTRGLIERHFNREEERSLSSSRVFSPEASEYLQRRGYVIYSPLDSSSSFPERQMRDYKVSNLSLSLPWHLEQMDGMLFGSSELALHPERLVVSESGNKRFSEQIAVLQEASRDLRGTTFAVAIPPSPDLVVDALFRHYAESGVCLLQDGQFVRTRHNGDNREYVLNSFVDAGGSLRIGMQTTWSEFRDERFYTAEVIVPK